MKMSSDRHTSYPCIVSRRRSMAGRNMADRYGPYRSGGSGDAADEPRDAPHDNKKNLYIDLLQIYTHASIQLTFL